MKSTSNLVFLVFNLIILVVLVRTYTYFREYFNNDSKELVVQTHQLEEALQREKLKTTLVANQFMDFRQNMAKILPQKEQQISTYSGYRMKQLSQSLRVPASTEKIDISSVLMARGREEHKAKKFDSAARTFEEVIEKYPVSTQIIEAHFLMGDSLFNAGQYEKCLDVIYKMMSQYPENEMTGYLMLRNAEIASTIRNRNAEAAEIYKTIMRQFKNDVALKNQAEVLLKKVEI